VDVRDRKRTSPVARETFSPSYSKEFAAGKTPPSDLEVERNLTEEAVTLVARHVSSGREPIRVMLGRPNDDVDEINKLGQAGLWSKMAEQLQSMKPLKDTKKDAYRLFNLGVANEALAYDAESLEESSALLRQASDLYAKALQMKSDEKYFMTPQARVAESLAGYVELERLQQTVVATPATAPSTSRTQRAPAKPQAAAKPTVAEAPAPGASAAMATLSNKDVIELVGVGLDDDNVIATIKGAKKVTFDLSVNGLKQLAGAKVSNRVITAMRAKAAVK